MYPNKSRSLFNFENKFEMFVTVVTYVKEFLCLPLSAVKYNKAVISKATMEENFVSTQSVV